MTDILAPPTLRGSPLPYTEQYSQYQRQLGGNSPQAPVFDPTKPPPPFDPANYYPAGNTGSIDKWIRSLAGAAAEDLTQFVPPIFSPLYRR